MTTKIQQKNANNFYCEICDFTCCKQSNYDNHLVTRKHQNTTKYNNKCQQIQQKTYDCECGKIYNHRASLFNHKKKCTAKPNLYEKEEIVDVLLKENTDFKNIILELVKTNTDMQKQMLEVCKNGVGGNNTINTMNSHNNNNNKTFNLNFFLNEQCKDAMNIMDFVNSVTLQLSDLESVGKLGYVEGLSNIMIKKLNEMDIYKRPVHCSDAKRETLYVKDNNIWEKENASHSKLRKAIKYISKKNSDLLLKWSNEHPASKNIHSKQNEEYMKMIYQAMGGTGEVEENENKIIKKISKMVLIEKNI
jgi:hypothetical protein